MCVKLGLSKIYDTLPENKFISISVIAAAGPVISDQRIIQLGKTKCMN